MKESSRMLVSKTGHVVLESSTKRCPKSPGRYGKRREAASHSRECEASGSFPSPSGGELGSLYEWFPAPRFGEKMGISANISRSRNLERSQPMTSWIYLKRPKLRQACVQFSNEQQQKRLGE